MEKTVITKYTVTEPHSESADKGLFTGMFEGVITVEDGEFSNVSFSDRYVLSRPIIYFHSPEMLKKFIVIYFKVLRKLDKLGVIDITDLLLGSSPDSVADSVVNQIWRDEGFF